jgi:hypothetical protein
VFLLATEIVDGQICEVKKGFSFSCEKSRPTFSTTSETFGRRGNLSVCEKTFRRGVLQRPPFEALLRTSRRGASGVDPQRSPTVKEEE